MSPREYKSARESTPSDENRRFVVDGRPYHPHLNVDAKSDESVARVASILVGYDFSGGVIGRDENDEKCGDGRLRVSVVSGGITNALFRVSGFSSRPSSCDGNKNAAPTPTPTPSSNDELHPNPHFDASEHDSLLVRVFGAEGMIDRDVETSTYAALCDAGIAHSYIGRFGNGRMEGWLDGYRAMTHVELSDDGVSKRVARQLAHLHGKFDLPPGLADVVSREPGMFVQMSSWMDQAKDDDKYPYQKGEADRDRARQLFDLDEINKELVWLRDGGIVPSDASVVFCHNDLLGANIMRSSETTKGGGGGKAGEAEDEEDFDIQLIDFEYGGYNYASFDVANHFNEWAGGTDDARPDYTLFPTEERRRRFVRTYLSELKFCRQQQMQEGGGGGLLERRDSWDHAVCDAETRHTEDNVTDGEVTAVSAEVDVFVMANHLFWGLWGVNQAKAEGCDGFDYLLYAQNRFRQFARCKEALEESNGSESKQKTTPMACCGLSLKP